MIAKQIMDLLNKLEEAIPSSAPHRFSVKDGHLELAIFHHNKVYPCMLTPDEEINIEEIARLVKDHIKQDQQRTTEPQNP